MIINPCIIIYTNTELPYMHVNQLTTSQAFPVIPREAIVYQDIKALQVSLLKERQAAAKVPRPVGYLRSQNSYLHISRIYCNTSTNSRRPDERSRSELDSHVHPLNRTIRWVIRL